MLHPIFSTVVTRPDLVVDHVSAYVALAAEEAASTGNDVLVRIAGWALAGLFTALALAFSGVAVMLGVLQGGFHWVLVLVPGVTLLLALIAVLATRRPSPSQRFSELRRQWAADLGLLKAAGGHHGR